MSSEYRFMVDAGLGTVSAVVATLPAAYTLGEDRYDKVTNLKYRLVFNAGNSQASPGFVVTPAAGSVGPYSVTVSTVSKSNHHIGAGVVFNATLTTGTYGWVVVKGRVGGLVADNTSVPTAGAVYIAADGKVELMPQSVITGSVQFGINLGGSASKTVTTGTKSGDCVIDLDNI
jgi:hypothetical protein